ncbi:hypothetical protein LB507_008700 [Fusarium sp. FIESC RH6]|nr:hypothetical protein LB507_008700 [Fusarium sp. FIESC RH6]
MNAIGGPVLLVPSRQCQPAGKILKIITSPFLRHLIVLVDHSLSHRRTIVVMSIRLTVASALEDFPFNPAVGFLGQNAGEQPCYHCITSLQRDVRICCVVEEGLTTRCIMCGDGNQKCCAVRPPSVLSSTMPQELLGAAQKLWNSYTAHVVLDEWSGLQRWRIVNCFEECTSAFRKTYEVIVNPHRNTAMDIIGAQHLEWLSKNMLVMMRQLAGEDLTVAEATARWVANVPPYTANCPEVHTLRECLQRVDTCPETAVPGEKSNRRAFGKKLKPELVALLSDASANDAPAPRISERML